MAFPNDTDYTYAERYGRTGNKYATPIDESVAADVVTALGDSLEIDTGLTGAISDNILADLITDAGGDPETDAYVDSLIAALVADATYPAAIGDALMADTDYLAAITNAAATELVTSYAVSVTGEVPTPGAAYDGDPLTTPSHTFDPVVYLGDDGISPGTVSMAFLMSDDSTETFTDPGLDGVLAGSADGTGVVDYTTGIITITWGTLSAKTGSEATATLAYDYLINAFEPEVVLAPASLTPIAEAVAAELATDSDFLEAIRDQAHPIWWVDTAVAAEAANVITVTFTQFNVAGTAETGRAQRFRMYFFQDLISGTRGLTGNMTATVTTGMVLEEVVANEEYIIMSDSVTGTIVLDIDDSTDDSGSTQYVVLVNEVTGECHTATCAFTDDTPP